MRYAFAKIALISLTFAAGGAAVAYADASTGGQIAQRWCASCHVVGENQTGSVPQGPPSFPTIAKSGMTAEQLRAFLSHPHGAMPDLALSRTEIDDLTAYIQSLR
jgi:mono/diheme cytochrome c family protein